MLTTTSLTMIRTMTIMMMMMMMMIEIVNGKPQDPGVFENVVSQAITLGGNMAEIAGNAALISKNMQFELPFASANSETQIANGAALRNNDDDSSSEEDGRKRSADGQTFDDSLVGKENLLAVPAAHNHLHRGKRSPCHHGGGGGGTAGGGTAGGGTAGGGTAGGDDGIDDEDLDVVERRRRANARRRKEAARLRAAARKRAANNSRKKKLVNDDIKELQVVARRKRQTELDDLNQNQANYSNELTQQAQQIADRLHAIWASFASSVQELGQKIKKHFGDQGSADDSMEI